MAVLRLEPQQSLETQAAGRENGATRHLGVAQIGSAGVMRVFLLVPVCQGAILHTIFEPQPFLTALSTALHP